MMQLGCKFNGRKIAAARERVARADRANKLSIENFRSLCARALNRRAENCPSIFARLYQFLCAESRERLSRATNNARRVGLCGITLSATASGRLNLNAGLSK